MTARDDYPVTDGWTHDFERDERMCEEIDRARGWAVQASIFMSRQHETNQRILGKLEQAAIDIEKMKKALGEQTAKANRYKRQAKNLKRRLEDERQSRDREIAGRIIKAGLKQGRREQYLDRLGDPITPEVRADTQSDLQKIAGSRKVNYDGSRVTDLHVCPWDQRSSCDGLCY